MRKQCRLAVRRCRASRRTRRRTPSATTQPAGYFCVEVVASSAILGRARCDSEYQRTKKNGPVWSRAPALADPLLFLRGWSRDPVAVGGPFASSPWTARRLAQATLDAAIAGGGPVLELGAGTGPVTDALIEAGCPVDQIVVVERDAELCRSLERRFPDLHVLHGNALDLGEILASAQNLFSARRVERLADACRPAPGGRTLLFRGVPVHAARRRHHPVYLWLPTARRSGRGRAKAGRRIRRARVAQPSTDGHLALSPGGQGLLARGSAHAAREELERFTKSR